MATYRYGNRLVWVFDGRITEVSSPTHVARQVPPLPRQFRAELRPQGWERDAIRALVEHRRGDPNAILRFLGLLSDADSTVPRTDQGDA